MKRYAQRCSVARALDVIGERWTPLIVRELLLGPKRYTDLLEALPGVGTNLLAGRLSDLQASGVIVRRMLPPPTPVAVYELTEAGEALAPVIAELRAWGQQYAPPAQAGDAVRPAWVIQSAMSGGAALPAGSSCELRVGNEVFELSAGKPRAAVRARPAAAPDAVLTIKPELLYRLASGRVTPARATREIEAEGDQDLAGAVLELLAGSVG
jgi:DNA-binding HxlR family transcriptional regulator